MNATQGLASGVIFGCVMANSFCQQPGTKLWEFTTGNRIESSPAIGADGTIYVGSSYTNAFWALSPDGTNKWTFYTPGDEIQSTPAVAADGTIYVGCDDGKLYALNSDGAKRWEFATGGYIFSSPTMCRSLDHRLVVVDRSALSLRQRARGAIAGKWQDWLDGKRLIPLEFDLSNTTSRLSWSQIKQAVS